MSYTAKVDGVEIPGVFSLDIDYEMIGSRERSPSGEMLINVVSIKKIIRIETRPGDSSDMDAVIDALIDAQFGHVNLELDEWANAVVVAPTEATVSRVLDAQGWYDTPKELVLSFEEV